jgi:hypothetical protein
MDHLDISQIRSKARPITQEVTRFVAARGAAGIIFGYNLDDLANSEEAWEDQRSFPAGGHRVLPRGTGEAPGRGRNRSSQRGPVLGKAKDELMKSVRLQRNFDALLALDQVYLALGR